MSPRVFACDADATPPTLAVGARLLLSREESHYLRRVRRVRPGATVEVIDGAGGLWAATVTAGDARATELLMDARLPIPQPARRVELLLGMPDSPATLTAITGATELGVHSITLVRCDRSQGTPPSAARQARVLRAAQRQCGRPSPPELRGPWALDRAIAEQGETPGVFAWADSTIRQRVEPLPVVGPRVWLVVGPEGGLTSAEVASLRAAGATSFGLGPWILRTETAVVAAVSRLL